MAKPKRGKLPRAPKPLGVGTPEREYLRFLLLYQRTFEALVKQAVEDMLPGLKGVVQAETPDAIRQDSFPHMDANVEKSVSALFAQVQEKLQSVIPDTTMRRWAKAMVANVSDVSRKNIARTAERAELSIEPLIRDHELTPYFQNVVDENVGLIRSISESRIPALKTALVGAISRDESKDTISELLQKSFGYSKNHARLVARDQVNKLNGSLNKYRQRQLGGKRYRWRTMKDEAVRHPGKGRKGPDHKHLEGKLCSWDAPPIVDTKTGRRAHPGEDIQCRCYAEMVLEDILDE